MPSSTTTTQSHARSHALLLLQKLLNLRDSASPLTLVLDTLEQSGKPVLREFMSRAQVRHQFIATSNPFSHLKLLTMPTHCSYTPP